MKHYQLTKTNFEPILRQVTSKNSLTIQLTKEGGHISSITSLSSYFKASDKQLNGKYKFNIKLNSKEYSSIDRIISQYQNSSISDLNVIIKIRKSKTVNKDKVKPTNIKNKSFIGSLFVSLNSSKVDYHYSLSITLLSNNSEVIQFAKSLSSNTTISENKLLNFDSVKMNYDSIIKMIDLDNYQETKLINESDSVLVGKNYYNKEIRISYTALQRHTKISGVNGSGKSGGLISIADSLLDNDKRLLVIDPHNETAQKIYETCSNVNNIKTMRIVEGNKYKGLNILLNYGTEQERNEYLERLTTAFYSDEIEDKQLSTVDAGKDFLKAGIEFNYIYLQKMKTKGLSQNDLLNIIKLKQMTLNDIVRLASDEQLRLFLAKELATTQPALSQRLATFSKSYNQMGVNGAILRLKEAVNSTIGQSFFESNSYLIMPYLKEGNSVLCFLNELSSLNRSIISKVLFSDIFITHKHKTISGTTYLFVDESATARLPNMLEIVTEARKFNLHLILAYQSLDMWKRQEDKEALKLIPNHLEFSSNENKKKIREFNFTGVDSVEHQSGFTLDYPSKKRELPTTNEGMTYDEIIKRIKAKELNINKYFYDQN